MPESKTQDCLISGCSDKNNLCAVEEGIGEGGGGGLGEGHRSRQKVSNMPHNICVRPIAFFVRFIFFFLPWFVPCIYLFFCCFFVFVSFFVGF